MDLEEKNAKRIDIIFDCMKDNRGDDLNILTWGYPIGAVYHSIIRATGTQKSKDKKHHLSLFRELIEREIQTLKNTLIEAEKKFQEEEQ